MKLERSVSADDTSTGEYPQIDVTVDDDGDVALKAGETVLPISYAQAQALNQTIGQLLMAYDHSFGIKQAPLRAV